MIRIIHIDQRAQDCTGLCCPFLYFPGLKYRVLRIEKLVMLSLYLDDVRVPGRNPERFMGIGFNKRDRIIGLSCEPSMTGSIRHQPRFSV